MNFSRLYNFVQVKFSTMPESKTKPVNTRARRSNSNAELVSQLELAAPIPAVPVPGVPGGVLPVVDPVLPVIPPVPAAPVESDTKMDLLMNMLASANASRASELNSILNRMESLQEASTRASRVSLLGKYLQAVLDISAHKRPNP